MKRILVVEDGSEYSDTLSRFLGHAFEFVRAGSGPRALARLAAEAYDGVFLDMRFDRAPDGIRMGELSARSSPEVSAPACTARTPMTPTPLAWATAMTSRGRRARPVPFISPGESSRLAMACTAAGRGPAESASMVAAAWLMPVMPQWRISPSLTSRAKAGRTASR